MGEYLYRICSKREWEALQNEGSSFGGDIDKSSQFIHLSYLHQIQSTLHRFFRDAKEDLYLLQIDRERLGEGSIVHELVDEVNGFPHLYGPSRSFYALPLSSVIKAEQIYHSGDSFTCSMVEPASTLL